MPPPGVELRREAVPGSDLVLTEDALAFIADLNRRFGPSRISLIERRQERQRELDAGIRPDFLVATRDRPWLDGHAPGRPSGAHSQPLDAAASAASRSRGMVSISGFHSTRQTIALQSQHGHRDSRRRAAGSRTGA